MNTCDVSKTVCICDDKKSHISHICYDFTSFFVETFSSRFTQPSIVPSDRWRARHLFSKHNKFEIETCRAGELFQPENLGDDDRRQERGGT